jgi:uncharacterized protein YcaQ
MTVTKREARRIALGAQRGLTGRKFPAGPGGAYAAIKHLGYVQIDTISVIERAHHHTLWNRVNGYTQNLIPLLETGTRKIFEYWSHAASYLPLDEYRYCLPRMRRIRERGFEWYPKNEKVASYVLDRIKAEGPLMAKDFASDGHKPGTWWDWKPAKIALEHLFMEGTILVVTRKGFQKVFDLAERILGDAADTVIPSDEEMAEYYIEQAERTLGIFSRRDIAYQRRDGLSSLDRVLRQRVESGSLVEARIEGIEIPYFAALDSLETAGKRGEKKRVLILSPFDNLIINRKRLASLFDYQYQIECYLPEHKRTFGYFCLPVLYGTDFIGRLDVKADRKA